MKRLALAALPLTLLAACGGGASDAAKTSDPASAASRISEAIADSSSSDSPPSQHETYKCPTGGVSTFSVSSSGSDVSVTRDGSASGTPSSTTSYIVSISSRDGTASRTLGQKIFTDGTATTYIFDNSTAKQRNIDAPVAETVNFTGALDGFGTQPWHGSATVNVDGVDIATCE